MVFQRVATDKLELSNSAIQCGPCQGIQVHEDAEADAHATSPRLGL